MTERELLEQFRNTPEGQKLLQAIRFAEGTAGPRGYQTMFGGGTFGDLSKHPDTVISSGGYKSAAAGAYQFMPGTWQSYAGRLGLQTFGPKEQDLAALALARDKLMNIGGLAALKEEGLSPRVSAALSPAWASFPTLSGKSYYGQPVKKLEDIQRVYGTAPTASIGTVADTSVAVSPVSLPRFDFKGALKNIVGEFAQKTLSASTADDKSTQYLELANALDIEGNEELANEYRNKALEAAGETPQAAADPLNVLQQIITAKQNEKMYNARAEALEQQINQSMGTQSAPTGALSAAPGAKIPGAQITSAVDTSGEPGFDFVIPGGRGAAFNLPFKAQVLKVVNDPWETNLEKGPGRRGYGNYVDVRGVDPATGRAFDVRLAHFDKLNPNLKPGAVVDPGTYIGTQGRTGSTTGAHVSADFYDPGKNTTSSDVLKIGYQIRDRLAKGQPVF
jgi:muramidase (phage lysozyme)/murein DD-endopeptidase MepM/ murein hydrolase activator NlpD